MSRNKALRAWSLSNAIVVLSCTCLQRARETTTNDAGAYRFVDLPDGTYLLHVLVGSEGVAKTVTLGPKR